MTGTKYIHKQERHNNGNEDNIDANVQTVRNEYATKMLPLFFRLETGPIFPYLKRDGHIFVRLKIKGFSSGMQQE
jgi:hypothetical protein